MTRPPLGRERAEDTGVVYRVVAWWDRPGAAALGEVDLGQGWARCKETVDLPDAPSVSAYLKSHPDAEGADVYEIATDGAVVSTHVGERTLLGWLMSPS